MTPEKRRRRSVLDFYSRWLSPEGYLGLHLVVGFALAAIGGSLFAEIAEDVFFETKQTLMMDSRAQAYVHSITTPFLTSVMRIITNAGDPITLAILSMTICFLLLFKHSHRRLYCFGAIMVGGALLNWFLKQTFHRSRPSVVLHLTHASGYSFPSGHSMGSMLFFGGLAYVLFFSVPRHWTLRVTSILFCAAAVSMVGGSRIYLGVHYLSDVLAGFVAALCWIGVCITGTEGWIRLRDRRKTESKRNNES